MCILDLSKALMYEFYYDFIKDKYGNDSRLLFIDINRLMYKTKTKDVYEDLVNIKKCFILAIIHLNKNFMMIQTNWFLEK